MVQLISEKQEDVVIVDNRQEEPVIEKLQRPQQ